MNADLSQRAAVATRTLEWTQRGNGCEAKLLEHTTQGGLRHTAIVHLSAGGHYAIESRGCIDMLVLDGRLTVGIRTLPAGWYLHDAAEALATATECTLLVKQRPGRADPATVIDTNTIAFEPAHTPGLWSAMLHSDDHGDVVLLGFDPGTTIEAHRHDRGEEFFVLGGEISDEHGRYGVHDWVRQPADSVHRVASPRGCLFFTFAHHLPAP